MRILALSLPLFMLSACGYSVFDAAEDISQAANNGMKDGKKIGTDPATIGNFTKLASVGPDNIVFKTGDSFQISASGNAEAIAELRYKLKDGKLVIGRESANWADLGGKAATVHVSAPTLAAISIAGSGNISADGLRTDDIKISVAGSGNAMVKQLQASALSAAIAGSGDVEVSGQAQNAKYSIAGSGDISASEFKTAKAEASIAGSGDIDLFASESVSAKLVGSGDVNVAGGAKCTSKSLGSGELNCS